MADSVDETRRDASRSSVAAAKPEPQWIVLCVHGVATANRLNSSGMLSKDYKDQVIAGTILVWLNLHLYNKVVESWRGEVDFSVARPPSLSGASSGETESRLRQPRGLLRSGTKYIGAIFIFLIVCNSRSTEATRATT